MAKSNKKLSVKKIVCHVIAVWFLCYVYSCTPHRWTSVERVFKETTVRALLPLVTFMPLATVDGTFFHLDAHKLLPMEPTPPYIIIPEDTPLEKAVYTLRSAWEKQDAIVVWKGFTKKMSKYRDFDYVKKTLNDDHYEFLYNYSNFQSKSANLMSVIDNMEDYYLGFSYNLLMNNKDTLLADFNSMLNSYGPSVTNLVPVNQSLHHAFLYQGMKYRTGMHQAPVSDWFFQVGNSKTWRFVQPKYSPYLRPLTFDGVSMMSSFDYLPDDCGIPYVDVRSDAGDMMFFPAHWWHEVSNNDPTEIGIAFGFRPHGDVLNAVKDLVNPLFANSGMVVHRAIFFGGVIKTAIKAMTSRFQYTATINSDSGLKGRIGHLKEVEASIRKNVPGRSWDRLRFTGNDECNAAGTCKAK